MKTLKSKPDGRGGKREGAGRKKGSQWPSTIAKAEAREALRKLITERLKEMAESQIENAIGIKYLVYRDTKSGKFVRVTAETLKAAQQDNTIEVWDKDPSIQAFTDLANRALDKPKEQEFEVSGNFAFSWLKPSDK